MSMSWFGDLIGLGLRSLIGFGVMFSLLYWAINVRARMWRELAGRYGKTNNAPVLARKFPDVVVILNIKDKHLRMGWHQNYYVYYGTIISVLEDGILISSIPPASFSCKDIYLPFSEMDIGPHPWMLWTEPYAISMDKASDLTVIIGRDTLQWLRQHTGRTPFHP